MSNPWASSFDEYRQTIIGEGKGKKEPRWQDDDCDGKWYEKSDTDGKTSKREKKAKAKHYKEEKYDNTKSPDYKKKKKALAKKHGGAKNIKGHPQYEHHGIDIEHLDGTQTQIVDVVKAPKMVAAPKLSNWREDFVWDEALKTPKLELEGDGKKDVKNKVEINPTVATEGYMSKDKEGHTTGGFRISNKEAKKAKERLKKKYKKEEVEQIDEIDGSKAALAGVATIFTGGLELARRAKNAAERLRQKRSDAMKKALGEGKAKGLDGKACWKGYKLAGTKKKGGKTVDNCVKEEEKKNFDEAQVKYYSGKDRNPNTGLPKGLKPPVKTEREVSKKLDYSTMSQSYEPEGEVLSDGYQRNPERDTRSARQRRMDDPDRGINSQAFRDFMAAQQSKPKKKKKPVKEGIVTELNRYEKETGESSGSMNMPKGRKTKKGGTKDPVMRAVRTSIRKETGKPHGQKKKTKGEKGNRQYGDRKTTPADTIAKRRQSRADAEKLMRDTSGT